MIMNLTPLGEIIDPNNENQNKSPWGIFRALLLVILCPTCELQDADG